MKMGDKTFVRGRAVYAVIRDDKIIEVTQEPPAPSDEKHSGCVVQQLGIAVKANQIVFRVPTA